MADQQQILTQEQIDARLAYINEHWFEDFDNGIFTTRRMKPEITQEQIDEYSRLVNGYWTPERMANAQPAPHNR